VAIRQYLWGYTLDHNLSPSQSIHFSQWQDSLSSPFFTFAPIVPSSNELQSRINDTELGSGFVLNYVKTVRSNLVVTAGADWIGEISGEHNAKDGVNFGGLVSGSNFPYISFDGQNAGTPFSASNGFTNVGAQFGGFAQTNNRQLGIVIANRQVAGDKEVLAGIVGRNVEQRTAELKAVTQDEIEPVIRVSAGYFLHLCEANVFRVGSPESGS
jgi:hypothetical protein